MNDLLKAIDCIAEPRLLVIGDIILDKYCWGNVGRVSPEAPVMVLKADRREVRLGGAASVAYLLRALDAKVELIGVIGDDTAGRAVSDLLKNYTIGHGGVSITAGRPSTTKERFIGRASGRHPYQILRVDEEVDHSIDRTAEETLLQYALATLESVDAVLISDYGKGVCTPDLIQSVVTHSKLRRLPVIVDPARGSDYGKYRGATLLKPNRLEASLTSGRSIETPDDAIEIGRSLLQLLKLEAVAITLDSDGMVLTSSSEAAVHIPTSARQVYDITGAGDMAMAMLGLSIAAGISLAHSVALANVAAGLEVESFGVTAVRRMQIRAELNFSADRKRAKHVSLSDAEYLVDEYRRVGKRIVFTNGCFDLLHAGHIQILHEAAKHGQILIVAINSDASVRRLKGPSRPIFSEIERIQILSALECVDLLLVFDDDTPHRLLERIRPDVLVKGGTYSKEEIVGREIVLGYGGQVHTTSLLPGRSTTSTLQQYVDSKSVSSKLT